MKKNIFLLIAFAAVVAFASCKSAPKEESAEQPTDNIYRFEVMDGQEKPVSLSDYEGKVLLVVNTATQCGFTPQYTELQSFYTRYHGRGFEVLDFPCNQFGMQAPGTNEEIAAFCTGEYGTSFPQMAKIEVNGEGESPLFTWLKEKAPFAGFDTTDPRGAYLDRMFRAQDSLYDQSADIKWNFTKFLINRNGEVVARFEPTADMQSIGEAIEALI